MFLNALCTDERCKARNGCAHMGPEMQTCYFAIEKELCELLSISWEQKLDIWDLLRQLRTRLDAVEGTSEDLVTKIAAKMSPGKVAVYDFGKLKEEGSAE